MDRKSIITVFAAIVMAVVTGCGSKGSSSSSGATEGDYECELIPRIKAAMDKNDASEFAMLCSYPISRDYPLHDIMDSAQMVDYYPVLVDDSIRTVILSAKPDDWWLAGWRGYTYGNGEYLWVDGGIYGINYMSKREQKLRDSLIVADTYAIHPSLRGDWLPETCLLDSLSGRIYRVDISSKDEDAVEPKVRLAIYEKGADLKSTPCKVLYGSRRIEGSAATHVYKFTGDNYSCSILYFPYEELRTLSEDEDEESRTLIKTYFLDLIDSLASTNSTVSVSPAL